jgi:transposase
MEISKREKRLLILHEYKLGTKPEETFEKICKSMGQGSLSLRMVKDWFNNFRNNDFDLNDKPRQGRPQVIDRDKCKNLIKEDPRLSSLEIAKELKCYHSTVLNIFDKLGLKYKHGVIVPHSLSQNEKNVRANTCSTLLSLKRDYKWLDNLITGDEKWVLYVNHTGKKQWLKTNQKGKSVVKNKQGEKKVMFCVWWGTKGIIHWEVLPKDTTVDSVKYCSQLDEVKKKAEKIYGKIYFLHDNARPHVSNLTREKLLSFKWTILPHPPYSLYICPTDYHLFHSLSYH